MKPKRQKRNDYHVEEDRLSNLPDPLLHHILSFVDSEYAVQTCILSTRWKNLWKHLPTLTLDSSGFIHQKNFTKFVSRILSLRQQSTALHSLDFERSGKHKFSDLIFAMQSDLVTESCPLSACHYCVLQFELECKKVLRCDGIIWFCYGHRFIFTTNLSL
jgi:hypothetical protein